MASGGYTPKFGRSIRGLDVIQAVYAFIMALGLRELFVGSYPFVDAEVVGTNRPWSEADYLFLGLALNGILLGIRFFWVPRNLRRVIYFSARFDGTGENPLGVASWFLSVHWLVIILHGMLFFLLCSEFEYIAFALSGEAPEGATAGEAPEGATAGEAPEGATAGAAVFKGYIWLHAALLILNALWIAWLSRYELWLRSADPKLHADPPGGLIWFRNNLICALLALAPFLVDAACAGPVVACLGTATSAAPDAATLNPLSPALMATLADAVTVAVVVLGVPLGEPVIAWILLVFFLNSIADLFTAGAYYILLEEVDLTYGGDTDEKGATAGADGSPEAPARTRDAGR